MNFLQVENLSLRYGDQCIINDVSFSIPKGKIVGILGPNGAGKSSIIKILAGLVFPESGTLAINNEHQRSFSELKKICGYLIDSPAFYPYLTAKQNLKIIQKIAKKDLSIEDLLEKVGLSSTGKKKVKHFSTGMKQRLAIAQALLRDPELLILDEPFNGLDPNGFLDIKNLLKELNEGGVTIFISSHLLDELEQFADTFILLHNGRIEFHINKEELTRSKKKITFTFEKKITKEAINYIEKQNGIFENDLRVAIRLSPDQIVDTINILVQFESRPINVETNTILQEKYFEIIK